MLSSFHFGTSAGLEAPDFEVVCYTWVYAYARYASFPPPLPEDEMLCFATFDLQLVSRTNSLQLCSLRQLVLSCS